MGCGIEPRKIIRRRGRGFSFARRQHVRHRYARCCRPVGVEEHITCKRSASEAGRSCVRPWARKGSRPASGRRGAVADDVRAQEVELCHSSFETGEQSRGVDLDGGAGGAKGRGRGDCEAAKHDPDTVPDLGVSQVLSRCGSTSPLFPKVGTVCGKAARTGLCGGREVTRVPTAPTMNAPKAPCSARNAIML